MRQVSIFSCFIWVLLFTSCANMMMPTGGKKDETPAIIKKRNPVDSVLNFKGGKLEFEFNELVELKDVQNQLQITPILKNKPSLSVHKKRVTLLLPDSLLEKNTTYFVKLGDAIHDVREGNITKNITVTFSTGAYFDSLKISGQIIDAQTGAPDTASWAMLYKLPMADTEMSRQKPMYAVKSVRGNFIFENLPKVAFKLFALKDENNNLLFDQLNEKIGFINSEKVIPSTKNEPQILYSFYETVPEEKAGLKDRKRNVAPANIEKIIYQIAADTVNYKKRTKEITEPLQLTFNTPLMRIDETKIRVYAEGILDATVKTSLDSQKKNLTLNIDWQQDAVYKIELLKGFAMDSVAHVAPASTFQFRTKRESDYGKLNVIFDKRALSKNAYVQLIKDNKKIAEHELSTTVLFTLVQAGTYYIRLWYDANNNKQWDTGNFKKRIQPEKIIQFTEPIVIRANFENTVEWKNLNKPKGD